MCAVAALEQVAIELCDVAVTQGSTLFAGAGVGCRAGLPSWPDYVRYLADSAAQFDADTADLMLKRLAAGSYLNALDYFHVSELIPDGTRLQLQAAPFSRGKYNAKMVKALVALPFDAIVTTNFDLSLHDAFAIANGHAPFSAELGDPSLQQAQYHWKEPYIARIHGRAEVPRTMVLDKAGYAHAEADPAYVEFLVHTLTRTRCAFVGYSFIDPAIDHVLRVSDARVGSSFPIEHLALLPSSAQQLRERLARYNIKVLTYDDANDHEALWTAVRTALNHYRSGATKPAPSFPPPLQAAQRFLAASYARAAMADHVVPLRSLISEGLILGILTEYDGLTRLEAAEKLRRLIPMTASDAEQAVSPAVNRLVADGVLREDGRQLHVVHPPENRIGPDLSALADGVAKRMYVRSGADPDAKLRAAIACVLEYLVLSRGWDLAAGLASAKRSDAFELTLPMDAALQRSGAAIPAQTRAATTEAIRDLLERPNTAEARILNRLARLSFGVEIALERGRSTLVHAATLPERVYLDASVLLPAITPGHPYRATYTSTVKRLQEAASRAGVASRVLVLDSFLNEVVTHRAGAIRLVADGGLEDPKRLARFISFTRADYTNVFVGGYSAYAGRSGALISFDQYLHEAAPYETEAQLAAFLAKQGIEAVPSKGEDPKEKSYAAQAHTELYQGYLNQKTNDRAMKPDVLIRHEAAQLARLMRETEAGGRSVFVTADSRLRRLTKGDFLGRIGSCLFSHTGLIQLVDLLVGLDADDDSLARLLWAVEARDERDTLRGYFTDLALRRYDAAMAMSLPRLLESIVDETINAAERDQVRLAFPDEDVKRVFGLLDRFEDEFYDRMAEEIRKTAQAK